jgi:hypothetical protein
VEKLILLQEEYIKFLEREVGNASIMAQQSGWTCPVSVYEEGCKFREEIETAKKSAKTNERENTGANISPQEQ